MIENLNARIAIVLIVVILAIVWVMPNFVDFKEDQWWFTKDKIVYGLDIQGGLHLVMGVDVAGVMAERTARMARGIRADLESRQIQVESVNVLPERRDEIVVTLNTDEDVRGLRQLIEDSYAVDLQILSAANRVVRLRYYDARINEFKKQVLDQSIEVIRNRIDEFGVAEPSIAAQGDDRILVQLPGIEDSARAKELINRAARLEFRIVSEELKEDALRRLIAEVEEAGNYTLGRDDLGYLEYVRKLNEDLAGQLPENTMVGFERAPNATSLEAGKIPYLLRTDTDLGGDELEDAFVNYGEFGEPVVIFRFGPDGRRKFADLTGANVNRQMAIVLDEVVQSAPVIQGRISSDRAQITLSRRNYEESMAEAQFIATALRAGALPAALEQLEERTVGPTLGADSIRRGQQAGVVGLILVFVFMMFYYRSLGVVADISLGLNLLFILAILTSLGATLTLPGVAGIVLTVGMAVDANVIIFERIKEELRKGAGIRSAVKDGFGNALSAILDANITTVIVCVVLMYYGTGPVRGFAVTLICGIITSLFTAIFVSRTMIEILIHKFKVQKLAKV